MSTTHATEAPPGSPVARPGAEPGPGAAGTGIASALARQLGSDWRARLPEAALCDAADRILDTVGVALAGTETQPARAARALARPESEHTGALVWGTGLRAPPELAVLANGTAAHSLDYDDSIHEAIMHTGAIVVPVALAIGETAHSSGRDMLAGIVAGYQVADFLGRLAFKRFQPRGFQATSVLGVFAGVATAGVLLGATAPTLVDAFGICGSMASGLMEFLKSGGDTKPLQVGWAARSALAALSLAEAGASGPSTVLEGEYGVFRSFAGIDVDPAAGDGGGFWEDLAISRVGTKFYPVCQAIHAPADAWKELIGELRADGADPVADVEQIVCTLGSFGARLVAEPRERKLQPSSAHQARFSLPWSLARIALDGDLTPASFADARLSDPAARAFAERVECRVLAPEDEEAVIAVVEVRTRGGSSYQRAVPLDARSARGDQHARVVDKFTKATEGVLDRGARDRVVTAIEALAADDGAMAALFAGLARARAAEVSR